MGDQDIRAALDRHWAASEAGDDDTEDEIYHDEAVLEYPQSGERIRGRLAIRTTRGLLPNKHFTIRRVIGRGDLWVTEYVISYDGKPSRTVSIMEFRDGKVFREIITLFSLASSISQCFPSHSPRKTLSNASFRICLGSVSPATIFSMILSQSAVLISSIRGGSLVVHP
jgi:SnoaL-like domain